MKTLIRVVAVMLFMLNTVVRYTKRLVEVPMVPSFSKVSLPVLIVHQILEKNTKQNML